ncbi:MAG: helix-turn-helix transcriptional regulator [Deltaproteobacteria bacterium]|nr:helix-turn-helix transcriptional regulator [Deltaproteobacteria bacterium]
MINERIKQARLISGMTQSEVVAKLGEQGIKLTKAGLSKYERGGSIPPPKILLKLSKVFSVKTNYFLKDPTIDIQWLAYRKNVSLGKKKQEIIQAFATTVSEGQIWLHEKLYPNVTPSFPTRMNVTSFKRAETAARKLREHWSLSDMPIESVTGIIEDRGGVVINYPSEKNDIVRVYPQKMKKILHIDLPPLSLSPQLLHFVNSENVEGVYLLKSYLFLNVNMV